MGRGKGYTYEIEEVQRAFGGEKRGGKAENNEERKRGRKKEKKGERKVRRGPPKGFQ